MKMNTMKCEHAVYKRLLGFKLEHEFKNVTESIRDLLNEHRMDCCRCDVQQEIDNEVIKND